MSYKELYELRQTMQPYVSRNDILGAVETVTGIKPAIVASGLNIEIARGFFLPSTSDSSLIRQFKGAPVIVNARDNNRCWSRLVIFKEAMHLFDTPEEATSSGDLLEALLNEFVAGNPDSSPMMRSEERALWMAIGLLSTETDRAEFQRQVADGETSPHEVAATLRMPVQYVAHLLSNFYKTQIDPLVR